MTQEPLIRKQRVALLVSGSGSNAAMIMERFQHHAKAEVVFVGCNRPPNRAGIYTRSRTFGLETVPFSKDDLNSGRLTQMLQKAEVDWIALAGFLMRIPVEMVEAYDRRIINIHPALLPKYGGKGMYNHHVHEAVAQAGELESGMTVHWVNALYDEGDVLFQAVCTLEPGDTAEIIGSKVLALEHRYYADVLESVISESVKANEALPSASKTMNR